MNVPTRLPSRPAVVPWSLSPLRPAAFVLSVALLVAGGTAGCRNERAAAPKPAESAAGGSAANNASVSDALQSSKLGGLPPAAQQAIRADVGIGRITQVTPSSSEAGVLYRVSYIQNGTARIATYDSAGQRITTGGPAATRPAPEVPTTGPIRQQSGG